MSAETRTPDPFPGESDPKVGDQWFRWYSQRRRRRIDQGAVVVEVCDCCGELPCSDF